MTYAAGAEMAGAVVADDGATGSEITDHEVVDAFLDPVKENQGGPCAKAEGAAPRSIALVSTAPRTRKAAVDFAFAIGHVTVAQLATFVRRDLAAQCSLSVRVVTLPSSRPPAGALSYSMAPTFVMITGSTGTSE